jgi:hypothetical protein
MSLYPEGHQPFIPFGHAELDQRIADIAHKHSLVSCLNMVALQCATGSMMLETLRAELFRAEELIDTQPLPPPDLYNGNLPYEVSTMLERLKAAQKCLEEWAESETCKRILEKYPTRQTPRTEGRDKV